MIPLHRIGNHEAFSINPDLIMLVEATPDTHIVLTTGTRHVVSESVDEITRLIREWRADILRAALASEHHLSSELSH